MSFNNQLTWPAVQAFTQKKKILTIQIKRKKVIGLNSFLQLSLSSSYPCDKMNDTFLLKSNPSALLTIQCRQV